MAPPTDRLRPANLESGFNLIWMSILLTVAALLMVAYLPGKGAGDYYQKAAANIQKLDKIEEAMKAFMVRNQRRPCPADGQYAINAANFGIEAATPGTCSGGTPAADFAGGSATPTGNTTINSNVVTSVSSTSGLTPGMSVSGNGIPATTSVASVDSASQVTLTKAATATATGVTLTFANNLVGGVIPTKSLGLPDDYALDEFGHRFTYVVDTRATLKTSCLALQNYPTNNGKGGLAVETSTGGTVLDTTMYAHISHGPDGHGAFPAQGSTVANRINTGSTDTDKLTNAGVNSRFVYNSTNFTNVKIRKEPTATFADNVYYADYLKNTCCMGPSCNQDGFVIQGTTQECAASSVAFGDITDYGYIDMLIAYPSCIWSTAAAVYVVFGQKKGTFHADPFQLPAHLSNTGGFKITNLSDRGAAIAVAVADVNGDGHPDIIISLIGGHYSPTAAIFIVFGQASSYSWPLSLHVNTLNGTTGGVVTLFSSATGSNSLATGDLNGDGVQDIVVGTSENGTTNPETGVYQGGSVYTIFGHSGAWGS